MSKKNTSVMTGFICCFGKSENMKMEKYYLILER